MLTSLKTYVKSFFASKNINVPGSGDFTIIAWLTDRNTMYFDKEDAWKDCNGIIVPLYTFKSN